MVKFSRVALFTAWKGQEILLRVNDVWDADDPFVRANPDLFADTPEIVQSTSGAVYRGNVEQATAAPGERRNR